MITVREFVLSGKAKLEKASLQCADPLLHAKQIVEIGMGWTASEVYLRWESPLSAADELRLEALLARRLTGEPFQYIAGVEGFWKAVFDVGPGVLIPRRETECLLEKVLTTLSPEKIKIAELGAGSGNIGISALMERPRWEWHAYELNPESAPYAERNRQKLLPAKTGYHLHRGDFFEDAPKMAPYDAIVANPPYVGTEEMAGLSKEVRSEPRLALDGGREGLEIIERLVSESSNWLTPEGYLFLEIGSPQETAVEKLLSKAFAAGGILRDYSNLPRVAWGKRG